MRRDAVRTSGVPPFLLVLLAFSAIACGEPAKGPGPATAPGEWRAFEGTGNATGQRKTLALGPDRKVSVVDLTGSLLLIGQQRLGEGFRGEFMGYSDSLKGSAGWSVWTDSRGDKVFGELRGEPVGTGSRFTGTFLGGTGRYAGVTGEYSFAWQYVIAEEGGTIQGRIVDLRGRYRIAPAPPSPSPR
ncbi:MAG: hypothetical protein ACM3L8_08020 [Verrucomicrobiota bacterium]